METRPFSQKGITYRVGAEPEVGIGPGVEASVEPEAGFEPEAGVEAGVEAGGSDADMKEAAAPTGLHHCR